MSQIWNSRGAMRRSPRTQIPDSIEPRSPVRACTLPRTAPPRARPADLAGPMPWRQPLDLEEQPRRRQRVEGRFGFVSQGRGATAPAPIATATEPNAEQQQAAAEPAAAGPEPNAEQQQATAEPAAAQPTATEPNAEQQQAAAGRLLTTVQNALDHLSSEDDVPENVYLEACAAMMTLHRSMATDPS
jgi:hypothetical protein